MNKILLLITIPLFLVACQTYPQFSTVGNVLILTDTLYSPSTDTNQFVSILLPKDYKTSNRTYPILYLLHGYGGKHNDWIDYSDIELYINNLPLIIVMPAAQNSWYVNHLNNPKKRYQDYLINDIQAFIEKKYPVDTTKRAIAGLSMGGYGAILLALKYPQKYTFAASLSGALNVPQSIEKTASQPSMKWILQSLYNSFGNKPNPHRTQNDPFSLINQLNNKPIPYLYFTIGTEDGFKDFLPKNRELTDSLRAKNIPYEYHERSGKHDWKFWNEEIIKVIAKLKEIYQLN